MADLAGLSAVESRDLVARGEASPRELVEAALARIETVQPRLNPFAFVFAERALEDAGRAGEAIARSEPLGPLHGLPVAFKDFTPTKGDVTTRGSRAYEHWVADFDPAIVRRFRAAGAILTAKTTTPEFAHAGFTASPLWGRTCNPWDAGRSSGGSSGGSGVAVTTGCVALAEGTDMGGSVRIPASHCGCVGLKPSLGRIPMDILPTVFDDMSHFGPLARTVEDAALFLRVAEGPDDADIQSQPHPAPLPERLEGDVRGMRLAVSEDLGYYHVEPEVAANLRASLDALADAGAEILEVELGWTHHLSEAWDEWWCVYQAAGFGHLLPEWRDRLDPNVVAMMERAGTISSTDFKRIETLRTEAWHRLAPILETHDALLCPTMAKPPPTHDDTQVSSGAVDADGRYHGEEMTSVFNCVGQCPVLSVPSGTTAAGLPTGLQIVGRRFDDPTVLQIGRAVERARPWRQWTLEDLPAGG
ncbi:MAG TPA: amidase [Thermohalobaculum sp.]|nr:amidase [Thermohalobaculum sp.]